VSGPRAIARARAIAYARIANTYATLANEVKGTPAADLARKQAIEFREASAIASGYVPRRQRRTIATIDRIHASYRPAPTKEDF
jgi:hypothetical protein